MLHTVITPVVTTIYTTYCYYHTAVVITSFSCHCYLLYCVSAAHIKSFCVRALSTRETPPDSINAVIKERVSSVSVGCGCDGMIRE